ncbi:hypothetical protein FGB62_9g324 [Gracilaria domingensis]|nr:hypothetical protein FGB62_9g324 [Gracilaria domingensis]
MHSPACFSLPPFCSAAVPCQSKAPSFVLCTAKPRRPSRQERPQSKNETKPKRRYRYWSSLSNTVSELAQYLNGSQTLPTARELESAGRFDLASALRRHGWSHVSQVTGLPLAAVARPRSLYLVACTPSPPLRMRPYRYWKDFNNLDQALRPYVHNHGLPTARQLLEANRSELVRAIRMHGGSKAVARRMDVRPSSKPDWSDLSVVQHEVRRAMQRADSSDDQLPNVYIVRKFGTRGLLHAIQTHHGGMAQLVRTMYRSQAKKEPVTRKPRGYWTEERLISEVLRCARSLSETDEPLCMPTALQLKRIGRSDVLSAIDRAGGVRRVAKACGLRTKREISVP